MWSIPLVVLVLYALVCVAVAMRQARFVWYPGSPPATTPADHGLAFDDLQLTTSDATLIHAWRLKCDAVPPRGIVLVCHGNAGSNEHRIPLARTFLAMGFDVLLFDYRGFGRSRGKPTEEGTYRDAEAAWTWAREAGFEPERIAVFGESLGGAVGIELARRKSVGALILEDTFTSMADMARRFYPWLPVRLLLSIRYDSLSKIGALRVPILVIHSRADELVPFEQGERLFAAAVGPKRFIETGGAHSAGGFGLRADWQADVRAFLESAIPSR